MAQLFNLFSKNPTDKLTRLDKECWFYLHEHVYEFPTAKLIVDMLDKHPHLRHWHASLYLVAADTVQRYRIRYAKWCRWKVRLQKMAHVVYRFGSNCSLLVNKLRNIRPRWGFKQSERRYAYMPSKPSMVHITHIATNATKH